MTQRLIYFGPPGTGKTATLLTRMEEAIASGVPPERIAFLTFTRRARLEALERVAAKFNLPRRALPYFRTIHSLAFKELGMREGDIVGWEQMVEFAAKMGLTFTRGALNHSANEDAIAGANTQGDMLLALDNLARLQGIPVRALWAQGNYDCDWQICEWFSNSYAAYKEAHALSDFTDVLLTFVRSGRILPIDIAFIDEAQDLSALQWLAALQSCAGARLQYIAGDDDQAIYKWAGADVNVFMQLEGTRQVLHQSHRLPVAVHAVALKLAQQIRQRVSKEFAARPDAGLVKRHMQCESLPLTNGKKWLLLVRNRYALQPLRNYLNDQGIVFNEHGTSSIHAAEREAIYDWERLRAGKRIEVQRARAVYSLMRSGLQVARGHKQIPGLEDDRPIDLPTLQAQHGLKVTVEQPWHDVLLGIPDRRRNYYKNLLRRNKTLRIEPLLQLDTIHGAKGTEAQCVGLFTDTTRRIWQEQERDPDNEHRVWYVGATRASEQLHIVHPQSRWSYGSL